MNAKVRSGSSMNDRKYFSDQFGYRRPIFVLVTLIVMTAQHGRTQAADRGHIRVRGNVQVSKAHANWSHDEPMLAADPNDPNKMLACSIVLVPEWAKRTTTTYRSENGGRSWEPSLTIENVKASSDPACFFGPDSMAYFSTEGGDGFLQEFIDVYRSRDAGKTWMDHSRLRIASQGYDRPFLVADDTNGKLYGRLYLNVTNFVRSLERNGFDSAFWGLALLHSNDGGASWSAPAQRLAPSGHVVWKTGNCDILVDSKVICVFTEQEAPNRRSEREVTELIRAIRSSDGGESLDLPTTISSSEQSPELSFYLPHIAVDRYSKLFRNRSYVVWSEAHNGIARLKCSYSDDGGKVWSAPTSVGSSEHSQIDFLPQVAVNRSGVIGVMWYRRSDKADLGYSVRFTASLDGGNTFLPSVQVSESEQGVDKGELWPVQAAVNGEFGDLFGDIAGDDHRATHNTMELKLFRYMKHLTGGETSGLVADAAGSFHAAWVDDRTGMDQLWTTAIDVEGSLVKFGDPKLSGMRDVTHDVSLVTSSIRNERNVDLSVTVRLRNDSPKQIEGPIALRLLSISSPVGNLEIVGSDNHEQGSGATWEVHGSVDNSVLRPGEMSKPITLNFRLSHPLPWKDDTRLRVMLGDLRFQVLAREASR
jgi:hypothetical protein